MTGGVDGREHPDGESPFDRLNRTLDEYLVASGAVIPPGAKAERTMGEATRTAALLRENARLLVRVETAEAEATRWRTMWDRHGKNDLIERAERAEAALAAARDENTRWAELEKRTHARLVEERKRWQAASDLGADAERERDEARAALARVQALCDERAAAVSGVIARYGEPGDEWLAAVTIRSVRAAITTPTASPATEGDTK